MKSEMRTFGENVFWLVRHSEYKFGKNTVTEISPVSEMTYTVSSGTLNSTIPYHTELSTLCKLEHQKWWTVSSFNWFFCLQAYETGNSRWLHVHRFHTEVQLWHLAWWLHMGQGIWCTSLSEHAYITVSALFQNSVTASANRQVGSPCISHHCVVLGHC